MGGNPIPYRYRIKERTAFDNANKVNNMCQTNRIQWLDATRVVAIVSISSNHAINRAFLNEDSINASYNFYPCGISFFRSIIFVFSRIGVLLFLMITGALILNKKMENEKDVKLFLKHNLFSILLTSEIWYFLMFWYRTLFHANNILEVGGIKYAFIRCIGTMFFINQETMGNMWYIPLILCLYLLLPYLNISIHKGGDRFLWIPIILISVESMIFPRINRILKIFGSDINFEFELGSKHLFSMFLVFVLIGYYVNRGLLDRVSNNVLIIVTLILFSMCVLYQYWEYTKIDGENINYNSFLLTVCCMFLFEAIRRFFSKAKLRRGITYVSRISFGIFFSHIFFVTALARLSCLNGLNPIIIFFILEIASLLLSIVIITILIKISFFRIYVFRVK